MSDDLPEWLTEEAAEKAVMDRLKAHKAKGREKAVMDRLKAHKAKGRPQPWRVFPGAAMPVMFQREDLPFLDQIPFEIGIVWVTDDDCRIARTHTDAFYQAKLRGIETVAIFRREQLGDFFDEPFTIHPDWKESNEGSPEGERSDDDRFGSISEGPRDIPLPEPESE